MIKWFKQHKPDYSSLDTESDGLHIIHNSPFVISFAFANFKTKQAISYTIDLENYDGYIGEAINTLYTLFKSMKKVIYWNATFDLHMQTNMGFTYPYENVTDAQIYVRLAHDAIPTSAGGVALSLKTYATKYIDPEARYHEKILKQQAKEIKVRETKKLKEELKEFGQPPLHFQTKPISKSWTKKVIDEFFKDKTNETRYLPRDVRRVVERWMATKIDFDNYRNYNRSDVRKYAHYDVIYTMEAFYRCLPVVQTRQNMQTAKMEEDLILPLYRMERVGFKFDREYALESKQRVRAYIYSLRQRLTHLAGQSVTASQSQLITQILNDKFKLDVPSSGKDVLSLLLPKLPPSKGKDFIETLQELRTLEKWYSVYIIKWLEESRGTDRVYTQIKQAGAVSGRVSSNFQQFPKMAIRDKDGNILFNPRKMFTISGGGYDKLIYIDYSQMELRLQALYTILISGGDLNFCRAYIPFQCHERNGKWYLDEDPTKEWHPVDLHSATTASAFPELDQDSKEFKDKRKIGKSTNFACTYGASARTLEVQFGYTREMALTFYKAYYNAFPKVKDYVHYVEQSIAVNGYAENLLGRKYYGASAHNCRNYLIQGTGADMLKLKIIECDKYIRDNNLKTRLQMNIHDELSFEGYKGEEQHIEELQKICQGFDTQIPILADIEVSYSTWADKVDYA